MKIFIALLRGVNVGGHRKVAMSELRDFVAALGFADPRTLLQSGNVVFRGDAKSTAQVETRLHKESKARLGLDIDFFVRTVAEWQQMIDGNPFRKEAAADPAHLLVMALQAAPPAAAVKALQGAIVGREVARVDGRHAYLVYPDGVGTSRLTHTVIEKHLGTRGTARNWNTALKLAALAASRPTEASCHGD